MRSIISFLLTICCLSITLAQSQLELNARAKKEFEEKDRELNQIYRMVMHEYMKDTVFISRAKEAQRAWLKFRDAQVNMKFPPKSGEPESISPMCKYYYLTELTSNRTIELKQWLDGVEEGDVCSGSITRTKNSR